jgi:hypothetical protein
MSAEPQRNRWKTPALIAIIASAIWWSVAGQCSLRRAVLLVAISSASFMVGCFVGFLFTSYDEEASTLGKIRDGLIGGILALTVTKTSPLRTAPAIFPASVTPVTYGLGVCFFATQFPNCSHHCSPEITGLSHHFCAGSQTAARG